MASSLVRQLLAAEESCHHTEGGRYWVKFVSDVSDGVAADVLDVFVARKVEVGSPFRTVVWPTVIRPRVSAIDLATECFRIALGRPDFSIRNAAMERRIAVAITNPLDEEDSADEFEGEPIDEFDDGGQLEDEQESIERMSAAIAGNIAFARLDYKSDQGVLGFSCRCKEPPDLYELTILMEQPLTFSHEMLRWILKYHEGAGLSDPWREVDTSEVERFLNRDWIY